MEVNFNWDDLPAILRPFGTQEFSNNKKLLNSLAHLDKKNCFQWIFNEFTITSQEETVHADSKAFVLNHFE